MMEGSGIERIITYEPGSLQNLKSPIEMGCKPFLEMLRKFRLERAAVGYEAADAYQPCSYISMHLYGAAILAMFPPSVQSKPADDLLARERARLTQQELERLRQACSVAGYAYERGAPKLQPGLCESETAAEFLRLLTTESCDKKIKRADGYVACVAGIRSGSAFGAYARSTGNSIGQGDFVLTHCNSAVDGFWTDITRTFTMGEPDPRKCKMYEAVFAARAAALAAIGPGVKARTVDQAAREVMQAYGLGQQFKHPAGHGVGFAAIDHNAIPRLHPKSMDVLETGMAFNVEPAAYYEGYGGLRHCDMVAVTEHGASLLTPFHQR